MENFARDVESLKNNQMKIINLSYELNKIRNFMGEFNRTEDK